jgi:putative serine protease PepD
VVATAVGLLSGVFKDQTTIFRSVPEVSLAADNGNSNAASGAVAWRSIDDAVAPSVVNISVSSPSGTVAGSGLVLLDGGARAAYVVTDRSLLGTMESTATGGSFNITLLSGHHLQGKLIGQDPLSGLAVLAVPNDHLMFPTLGSVADMHLGDQVMVVGSQDGSGGSVFQGLVAAQDQTVGITQGSDLDDLIAVSTSQTSSSSDGGPLLNAQGRVVGITLSLQPTNSTESGLTFAVPIDEAINVSQEIVDGQHVDHPWIGISGAHDLAPALTNQLGIPGGSEASIVESGGPAARAGLSSGDVITAFDGQTVTSTGNLLSQLFQCQPGRAVQITFLHGGKTITSKIEVINEPVDGPPG